MHDLSYFRANLDVIKDRLLTRGFSLDVDTLRSLDTARRAAMTEAETLQAGRNASSMEIAKLKKAGEDTTAKQVELRASGEKINELNKQASELDDNYRGILAGIPNLPHETVPIGKGAEDNVEIHKIGEPGKYDFEPQAHWDLGPDLGILDFERAVKVTGARFVVYIGIGARLERALINFMLDVHTQEHGYTEVLTPFLVNSASLYGTGNLPKFGDDLFRCEGTDLWLAPTAEVPVTNLFRDETLDADNLPISLCAYTPCFRSEAGSHGRDVRGIIRQHQFQKVELVKFARADQSHAEHEKLTSHAEDILRRLELPFRRMLLCTGDMGFSSAKTYDLEVWLPGQNDYKEISSCSNFEGFQARRSAIKAKAGKGKAEVAHTLNGSGLAVGRTWVALVENHQQKDGSVKIPKALQPYLNAEVITKQGKLG